MEIKTSEEIHDYFHDNPFCMEKWVSVESLKEWLKEHRNIEGANHKLHMILP